MQEEDLGVVGQCAAVVGSFSLWLCYEVFNIVRGFVDVCCLHRGGNKSSQLRSGGRWLTEGHPWRLGIHQFFKIHDLLQSHVSISIASMLTEMHEIVPDSIFFERDGTEEDDCN